jgi:hypothetical protein
MLPESPAGGKRPRLGSGVTLKSVSRRTDGGPEIGGNAMRKLVTGAAIAALFFAVRIAWNLVTAEPIPEPTQADLAAEAAEFDALVAQEVESGAAAPARGWLGDPDNLLFEGDPQSVQALIDELYAAGAVDVWFIGIEPIAGRNVSASIAVQLPEQAAARAPLFDAHAQYWQDTEPDPDTGQRFLEFAFD